MGRGRAKAKQTRVARELKYHSPSIDLDRLRSDLGVAAEDGLDGEAEPAVSSGWADLYEQDDEDDEAHASSY
jgi:hypothetical protein